MKSSPCTVWTKIFLGVVLIPWVTGLSPAKTVGAYSSIEERPVFLAWPLPTYIGVARISQFPNTPWTWNYLGLNPGQQCPPAFGYVLDPGFWPVWKDASMPEKQDMAQADPHNFEMVNCYSTLGEAGKNGHEGTDIKAPAGTPAYASADGRVAGWRLADVNNLMVLKHCLGGTWGADGTCVGGTKWYTSYMHIVPDRTLFEMEKEVRAGEPVGTIYNQGDNSHLHFEVGVEKRSYENYVNPWGRDESPWVGCMWKEQSLCVQPNPGYKRIGFLTTAGRFFLQDDASNLVEVFEAEKIDQFQMYGDRVAMLDQNGNLLAKDIVFQPRLPFGYEHPRNWVNLGGGIVSFQMTDNRLIVLEANGTLQYKAGDLQGHWVILGNKTRSFSTSQHRVGYLTYEGELFIQEGNPGMDWLPIASNVQAFALTDSRVAVLDLLGNLFVQEGSLSSEWKQLGTNIQAFQLAGTRVAMVDQEGVLFVNDGNLRAEFVLQAKNVQRFQLADRRILILDQNGTWKIKEGDLYQTWKEFSGFSVKEMRLNGGMPVTVKFSK